MAPTIKLNEIAQYLSTAIPHMKKNNVVYITDNRDRGTTRLAVVINYEQYKVLKASATILESFNVKDILETHDKVQKGDFSDFKNIPTPAEEP